MFTLSLIAQTLLAQNGEEKSLEVRHSPLAAGMDALIVIDDQIFDSVQFSPDGKLGTTLYKINLDDIESINVLKNEDAIKAYGDKAKYGVIIIATRNGKFKKTKFKRE